MRNNIRRVCLAVLSVLVGALVFATNSAFADESEPISDEEALKDATSISISPVSKILEIEANKVYADTFKVSNNGTKDMKFEVYASPYSFSYSEEEGSYVLGFNDNNSYTQITRWITFKDVNGNFVENPQFVAKAGESVDVMYHISTPSSIPSGGQYAVLFAHTMSDEVSASGIKTEASPGLVVYGRSTKGETIVSAEISNLQLMQTKEVETQHQSGTEKEVKNIINASAKVKNNGNLDFMASGTLEVRGIFGQVYYSTSGTQGKVSVIPEAELSVSDSWDETPYFGIFNATWTVATPDGSDVTSRIFFIFPLPIIVAIILLLTIITIWVIMMVRKRKERRSRHSM